MAVDGVDLVNALPGDLVSKIEFLITILQALGGVIILYIVFNIINTIINRKKNKKIDLIVNYLAEIKEILARR